MNGTGNDRREGRRGPGPRGYALALRAGWALAALLAWTGCQGEIDPTPAEEAVRPPPPFEPGPAYLMMRSLYYNFIQFLAINFISAAIFCAVEDGCKAAYHWKPKYICGVPLESLKQFAAYHWKPKQICGEKMES